MISLFAEARRGPRSAKESRNSDGESELAAIEITSKFEN
jgi:hypothetical protein